MLNARLAAESVLAPQCLPSCHCIISVQAIAMFCMHALDVDSLTRQVSQSTETDHTLHGADML